MSDVDFEQVFNAIPANYLVYDLDWNIVAITDVTLGVLRAFFDQVDGR
ncbi:hypothetical protein [Nocardia salmonicida]